MRIVAVIVARMTSSRLPGKPLLQLAGKTSLERHVERCRLVSGIEAVYLATSRHPSNGPLIAEAERLGLKIYAGEEEDIVARFLGVGKAAGADALVRIGCDKPLFCHELLQTSVSAYQGEDYVYVGGTVAAGIGHEILSHRALGVVHRFYHGTAIAQYIREHPHRFSIRILAADPVHHRPEYRLSMDTPGDYALLEKVFSDLGRDFAIIPTREALKFLDDNPEIARLNRRHQEKNVNVYIGKLEQMPVFRICMTADGTYQVFDRSGEAVSYAEFQRIVQDEKRWRRG